MMFVYTILSFLRSCKLCMRIRGLLQITCELIMKYMFDGLYKLAHSVRKMKF
jgi:hypothetical protein